MYVLLISSAKVVDLDDLCIAEGKVCGNVNAPIFYLKNDPDLSVYSRGRCYLLRIVCFPRVQNRFLSKLVMVQKSLSFDSLVASRRFQRLGTMNIEGQYFVSYFSRQIDIEHTSEMSCEISGRLPY